MCVELLLVCVCVRHRRGIGRSVLLSAQAHYFFCLLVDFFPSLFRTSDASGIVSDRACKEPLKSRAHGDSRSDLIYTELLSQPLRAHTGRTAATSVPRAALRTRISASTAWCVCAFSFLLFLRVADSAARVKKAKNLCLPLVPRKRENLLREVK